MFLTLSLLCRETCQNAREKVGTPPFLEEGKTQRGCTNNLLGFHENRWLPLELGDVLEQRRVQVRVVEHRLGVAYLLLGVAQRLLRRHPPVRRLISTRANGFRPHTL
jgi:hypothetical protein